MSGPIEWLIKLLFFVMLVPFFICLFVQLAVGAAVVLLPWVIGLVALVALVIGVGVGLALRRRLPPPRNDRCPRGEGPRIRRPRGVRTER